MNMSESEQQEYDANWNVAIRAQFAMQDGYFTADEFEHLLYEMGILDDWRKAKQ
jgi:hypothetical protein